MSKWFENLLEDTLQKISDESESNRFKRFIKEQYEKELNQPPRIAIIGATGVGKSSTINALFGTNEPISHTRAKTALPEKIAVTLDGSHVQGANGDLIIYDMPGIGESIDRDEEHIGSYRDILSICDVAVWIVSAVDRRFTYDQFVIRDVLGQVNKQLLSRLVVGVNKVDLLHPNNWDTKTNLPSREQEQNLQDRLEDILHHVRKVILGFPKQNIVGYSATKRYRLEQLFGAMLRASPDERAWVLSSRQEIADFWDMVDPAFREQYQILSEGIR